VQREGREGREGEPEGEKNSEGDILSVCLAVTVYLVELIIKLRTDA
jgi:hypothetical protein